MNLQNDLQASLTFDDGQQNEDAWSEKSKILLRSISVASSRYAKSNYDQSSIYSAFNEDDTVMSISDFGDLDDDLIVPSAEPGSVDD